MKMRTAAIGLLALLLTAAALPGAVYEKYLVPGNPLDDSILRLREEIQTRPDVSELHANLGVKLWEKRFPKDAVREFKKAVKLDKRNYQARFNLGLAYEALGENFKAWRAFKRTLHYKPGHDLAHYHLGMIYEKWGFHRAAVSRYAKAVVFNPGILDPKYNAAIVYNEVLPEVLARVYEKYQTARVQPFQAQAVPPPPPAEVKPAAPEPPPASTKPPVPEPKPKKEAVMQPAAPPAAPTPPTAPQK
jgi:tetratricopeptide (TPR) repeat protein